MNENICATRIRPMLWEILFAILGLNESPFPYKKGWNGKKRRLALLGGIKRWN